MRKFLKLFSGNIFTPQEFTFTLAGFVSAGTYTVKSDKNKVFDLKFLNASVFDGTNNYMTIAKTLTNNLYNLNYTESADINDAQGICYSPDYCYTFGTTRIVKRHRDNMAELIINSTPFAGIPYTENALNHVGDGCYLNGKIYAPCEYTHTGSGVHTDENIVEYDADTVEQTGYWSTSANEHSVSGIGTDGTDLFIVGFYEHNKVYRYTKVDGNWVLAVDGEITLDYYNTGNQGITITGGEMFISTTGNGINVYTMGGVYKRKCYGQPISQVTGTGVELEGLDFTQPDKNVLLVQLQSENIQKVMFFDGRQKFVEGFGFRIICTPTENYFEHNYISMWNTSYGNFYGRWLCYNAGSHYNLTTRAGYNSGMSLITATSGSDTANLDTINSWYDSKTRKIYASHQAATANADYDKGIYMDNQNIIIGTIPSLANKFKGTMYSIEAYNIISGVEERVWKVVLA